MTTLSEAGKRLDRRLLLVSRELEVLLQLFGRQVQKTRPDGANLMQLPKYHAIVRTAVDGVPTRPFVIKTPPPPRRKRIHADPVTIRRVLARRFGRMAATV